MALFRVKRDFFNENITGFMNFMESGRLQQTIHEKEFVEFRINGEYLPKEDILIDNILIQRANAIHECQMGKNKTGLMIMIL